MTSLHLAAPSPFALPPADTLFPRVLLGIDFGSASLAAARWATTHVALRAEAILAHVIPFPEPDRDGLAPDEALHQMRPALTGGLGGFGATLDVSAARNLVRVGSPSRWLSALANAAGASLVVLGRRGDANRTRVGEPNVIERAARRTTASVLVVPEGTTDAPGSIIAAVDDSAFAPRVLRVARQLARLNEVPLVVLHVLSPAVGAYERVIRSARQMIVGAVERRSKTRESAPVAVPSQRPEWLLHLARDVGWRDGVDVTVGDPAREITAAAMLNEAPLVVVGLRGADEAPPGSVGSVARELVKRAPVPVLAVNEELSDPRAGT